MIFKRKLSDRIIHVLIYTTNEGIEPGATHWSGYMTERNFFQICGRYQLKDTTGKDEVLLEAIKMAEQLGANDTAHGVIPLLRMDELIMRDFIVYNKDIMHKQAVKKLPPKRVTKEYLAYKAICSMGYRFSVDLNRFINNGENVFSQLITKQ